MPQVTFDAPPLGAHAVAVDGPGIGTDRLGAYQRPDLDQALEVSPGDGLPARLIDEEPAQLTMGRKDAVDADALVLGLAPQAMEVVVGQLINLEKRAQLDVPHAFVGQQAEEPRIGEPIFHRVGLDAQLQGKVGQLRTAPKNDRCYIGVLRYASHRTCSRRQATHFRRKTARVSRGPADMTGRCTTRRSKKEVGGRLISSSSRLIDMRARPMQY